MQTSLYLCPINNIKNVKRMTKLCFKKMENVRGGGDIIYDRESCEQAASALEGVTFVFSFASAFTGVGSVLSIGMTVATFAYSKYCQTL